MSDKKKPRLSIAERAEGLRKRADEQKNVTNLVTTLQQVNPDNTSPKNAISILVAKFGYPAFEQALELERSVPMTMPDSMRESLLLKFATDCGLQNFQDIHCVVKSFPELIKVNSDPANVRVLVPPTDICLRGCTDLSGNPGKLTIHDPAKDVTYHSLAGTSTKKKVTLRCRKCNTNYGFAMYGDSVTGYRFYTEERFAVEASNCTYIDRRLYNFQLSLSLHAWVSFSAFSESYKDALTGVAEGLGRKTVSAAFFWGEVEMELRRLHLVDTFVFKTKSFEEALDIIEEHRQKSIYPHADADCTPDCKKRGCGRLYVADGIWKLVFTHCMMRTENVVAGIPLLGYPDVCTNELRPGHAFCEEHCHVMESLQIKTKLREFLASCGLSEKEATQAESGQLCEESLRKVKDKISALAKSHGDLGKAGSPPIKSQVGTDFVKDHPQAVSEASSSEVQGTEACNKDTGQHKSLNMLSRGHLVIVGGGGIISKFDPIYRCVFKMSLFAKFRMW
ncbi:uncharacterized protein LOC118421246 [Branchiostoma floridae]|uniref:Uncharacterized protein LOC118421246 n=1 Tax=Branchiostoma floridae TaxID=7739 RepID=A0A9J7LK61_BRAFL|nr:uncharacterized protein LOC118421246 [Branchiostoma floridae]XP_035684338.1 uncharacterized protein LOC118421246 [Branchiostoma floridae]